MLQALLVVVTLTNLIQGADLQAVPLAAGDDAQTCTVSEPAAAYATFIPVCRDHRGTWDRRACRHVRRSDPSRLILA